MSAGYYTTDPIDVIDVDSHLTEPAGLWTDHAPSAFKDRVPRVVEDADGRLRWQVEGKDLGPITFTAVAPDGSRISGESYAFDQRFEEVHKGAWDTQARLGWMDERRITRQVVFPNLPGFGGDKLLEQVSDPELRLVCVEVYNDAMAEMAQESDGRLLPNGLVPWWDIDQAIVELRRVRNELGLKGITMCDAPQNHGFPTLDCPEWAPFWSACEDLDVVVSFHIGTGSFRGLVWGQGETGERLATFTSNSFLSNSFVISNLIFSGLLLRHPRLRIFSAETGIGWLPFFLEAMDYQWHENLLPDIKRDVWKEMLPSEVFRRNIYASFWFEQFGPLNVIDIVGEDNIMFETDFPHGTALTERVRSQVAATLDQLTPQVRKKLMHDNAARLYRL